MGDGARCDRQKGENHGPVNAGSEAHAEGEKNWKNNETGNSRCHEQKALMMAGRQADAEGENERNGRQPAHQSAQGVASLGALMGSLPQMLGEAQRATHLLAGMAASGGLRLDAQSTQAIAKHRARHEFWTRTALWTGAIALVALATLQVL